MNDYTFPPFFVDLNWAKKCITVGKKQDEEKFKPIVMGDSISIAYSTNSIKQEVTSHLFKGLVFTINDESYTPTKAEQITKSITDNSGRLVPFKISKNNANYVICNDGFVIDNNSYTQTVISHRWVEHTI